MINFPDGFSISDLLADFSALSAFCVSVAGAILAYCIIRTIVNRM